MKELARMRKRKGFSQRALAKESGVSPATIYELENGRRSANPSTLRKLAGALDIEVADLLEEPEQDPLDQAPASQATLFNNGTFAAERRFADLLASRLAEARRRIERYERILSKVEAGQLFTEPRDAGEWALDARDDIFELSDSISRELIPAYSDSLDGPIPSEEFDEVVSVAEQLLGPLLDRLSALAKAAAETEAEKEEAERRREEMRRWTRELSA